MEPWTPRSDGASGWIRKIGVRVHRGSELGRRKAVGSVVLEAEVMEGFPPWSDRRCRGKIAEPEEAKE